MRAFAGALLCLAAGCRGFATPTPELLASLDGDVAPTVRARATVRVESDALRGEFEAIIVARPSVHPAVRMQLFPDLGGKVLDVTATRHRIVGAFAEGERVDLAPASGERHPIVFMGLTLLEMFSPLTPERVRGARRAGDLWELDVVSVGDGLSLRVFVDARGRVLRREFRYRSVGWTQTLGMSATVRAPGFSMRFRPHTIEPGIEIGPEVFRP